MNNNSLTCEPNPCQNSGKCLVLNGLTKCLCFGNYANSNCTNWIIKKIKFYLENLNIWLSFFKYIQINFVNK